ncbi:MAG: hypothetical protein ACYC91_04280 [Solirubrobacteraceae bacterium]
MPPPSRQMAQMQRDAALRRASHVRLGAVGASAALTAGLAAVVSAIVPGGSSAQTKLAASPRAAPAAQRSASLSTKMPPLKSGSQLGLQASGAPPGSSGATGSTGNTGSAGSTGAGSTGNTGGAASAGNTGAAAAPAGNTGAAGNSGAGASAPVVVSGGS